MVVLTVPKSIILEIYRAIMMLESNNTWNVTPSTGKSELTHIENH